MSFKPSKMTKATKTHAGAWNYIIGTIKEQFLNMNESIIIGVSFIHNFKFPTYPMERSNLGALKGRRPRTQNNDNLPVSNVSISNGMQVGAQEDTFLLLNIYCDIRVHPRAKSISMDVSMNLFDRVRAMQAASPVELDSRKSKSTATNSSCASQGHLGVPLARLLCRIIVRVQTFKNAT